MTRLSSVALATYISMACASVHAAAPIDLTVRDARATLTPAPPVIDGRLDEPAWSAAPAHGDFVERSPVLRGVPAEATEFRVLVDATALYVGVTCHDSQPAEIRARTLQRDSTALFDDDAISLKLDPLRDRRTTYGFALNPAGGRVDYRGVNNSVWQIEVDHVWQGAAQLTPTGWSAEFVIPWSTLGLDPANLPDALGLDLSRDHARSHATSDWALIAPPHEPIAASEFGTLTGLPTVMQGAAPATTATRWAISPWVLAGFEDPADGDLGPIANAGLDVEADLGDGFNATLTLNTDFAQVEVDDVTTNLDRFDIFLPEKRDFFLKDGDLFTFGEPGWASLFHSRTIGLADQGSAVELPIVAGMKLSGRSGGLRVGGLSVLTRPAESLPWRLDSVVRLQNTFTSGSAVGLMATHRQSLEDVGAGNTTVGFDGLVASEGSPLQIRTFAAGALDRQAGESVADAAAHVDLRWQGELLRPRAGYAYFGPELRPALGYFQRTGIHNPYAELAFVPRIESGGLETFTAMTRADVILGAPGADLLDWTNQLGLQLDWSSGAWLGLFGGVGEVTVPAFTLGADHEVAAGTHGQSRIQLEGATPSTAAVSTHLSVEYRELFGGTAWLLGGSLVARPGTWLGIQLDANVALVALPSGDFTAPTINLRLTSGLTSNLELSAFSGWSDLDDTLSFQARLRWSLGPGSDLFVVWELRLDDESRVAEAHDLVAKLALRFP